MITRVTDLRTGREAARYSLGPREAVMAAYAQDRGDYNTWDYETRYGDLPREGEAGWHCGDFSAPKAPA